MKTCIETILIICSKVKGKKNVRITRRERKVKKKRRKVLWFGIIEKKNQSYLEIVCLRNVEKVGKCCYDRRRKIINNNCFKYEELEVAKNIDLKCALGPSFAVISIAF